MTDRVRITVTFEADLSRLVAGVKQLPFVRAALRTHIKELYWVVPDSVEIKTATRQPDYEPWWEPVFAREKKLLEAYVAGSCNGDDPIKVHARTIAHGRLLEIDVLRARLAATPPEATEE